MNLFNQNPIRIDSPMAVSFWTALRQAGVLSSTQGKPIQPTCISWIDPGTNASFVIMDGVGNAPNNQIMARDTGPDFLGPDPQYTFVAGSKRWRDFQVTVITGGQLEISYR